MAGSPVGGGPRDASFQLPGLRQMAMRETFPKTHALQTANGGALNSGEIDEEKYSDLMWLRDQPQSCFK